MHLLLAGYPESTVVQQLMQYFLTDMVQSNLSAYGASPMPSAYVSRPLYCRLSVHDHLPHLSARDLPACSLHPVALYLT